MTVSIPKVRVSGMLAFALHSILLLWIFNQHYEGSWGGFFVFVIDFPVSLLFLLPGFGGSWLAMGVIGGIWWYLVAVGIVALVNKFRARHKTEHSQ